MSSNNANRRDFLKNTGIGLLFIAPVVTVVDKLFSSKAQAQNTPPPPANTLVMVKESDPMAKSLAYVEDATKVDPKKRTDRSGVKGSSQFCFNCNFYQTTAADPSKVPAAPCTLFANKGVKGKGWCNSWTPKPGLKI